MSDYKIIDGIRMYSPDKPQSVGEAVREWWIDPNDDPEDDGDIRCFDAFSAHPKQGDLLWQSQLTRVVEHSAYLALEAKLKEFDEYYTFQTLERVEAERDEWKSEHANLSKFAEDLRKERDALAAQLAEAAKAPPIATNTGWPHEKKLHERVASLETERDRLRAALERIAQYEPTKGMVKVRPLEALTEINQTARKALESQDA